jgi:hypothetical protein
VGCFARSGKAKHAGNAAVMTWRHARPGDHVLRKLSKPLWYLLAILFLIEAWFWERCGPWIRGLVDRLPWRALKARIAAAIERLPPVATLVVFLVPVVAILPFKLAAVAFVARGHVVLGLACYVGVKVVGFGLTAFVFDATRDKLMRIPGFPPAYRAVMRVHRWAHGLMDPYKAAAKAWAQARIAPVRARVAAWLAAESKGRFGRMVRFLRSRAARG